MKTLEVIDLVSSSSSEEDVDDPSKKRQRETLGTNDQNKKAKESFDVRSTKNTSKLVLSSDSSEQRNTFHPCKIQSDDNNLQSFTYEMDTFISSLRSPNIHMVRCLGRKDASVFIIPPLIHCGQSDQWSCGYQNMQMLLASLLPLLSKEHAYFKRNPTISIYSNEKPNQILIPSISEIQQQMEYSWNANFDPEGAKHFSRAIYKTMKKVGAVEVASLLSFWYLDATVLQFARTKESRQCLVSFVWGYFLSHDKRQMTSVPINDVEIIDVDDIPKPSESSSYQIALDILAQICPQKIKTNHNQTGKQILSMTSTTIPSKTKMFSKDESLPLFLQWEGHSVTVIGIEYNDTITDAKNMIPHPILTSPKELHKIYLLVLDPLQSMTRVVHERKEKESHTNKNNPLLQTLRLSIRKLIRNDCQLIVSSTQSLGDVIRLRHRHTARTIHAFA